MGKASCCPGLSILHIAGGIADAITRELMGADGGVRGDPFEISTLLI